MTSPGPSNGDAKRGYFLPFTLAALLTGLSGPAFAVGDGAESAGVSGARSADREEEGSAAAVRISLEGAYFYKGQFPALKIHIDREGHATNTLNVRFPEIIEATNKATGKRLKFYQDNRSPDWPVTLECEPLDRSPAWKGNARELGYTMRFDNGMVLTASAKTSGSEVLLTHTLDNATALELEAVTMWNCVQLFLAPEFKDRRMVRTAVPVEQALKTITGLCPGFSGYQESKAHLMRFLAFRKGTPHWYAVSPHVAPRPGHPEDPEQSVFFWQVEPSIDSATIATFSRDGELAVVTSSDEATMVWTNPGITCHHADASVPLCGAGATARVATRVRVTSKHSVGVQSRENR